MKPKIVFFGGADYGKSTVIGYMYAVAHGMNIEGVERKLREEVGPEYRPDFLYPYLVNPHAVKSILLPRKSKEIGRASSVDNEMINIEVPFEYREPLSITLIATPGHQRYVDKQQLGISMSDIGVFCLEIEKVLSGDFIKDTEMCYDLYSEIHQNGKLIYLLTMFDRVDYSERVYNEAKGIILEHCRTITTPRVEHTGFGLLNTIELAPDAIAIIPVAIEFKTREKKGVNIFEKSSKTPWYRGFPLKMALLEQSQEISVV